MTNETESMAELTSDQEYFLKLVTNIFGHIFPELELDESQSGKLGDLAVFRVNIGNDDAEVYHYSAYNPNEIVNHFSALDLSIHKIQVIYKDDESADVKVVHLAIGTETNPKMYSLLFIKDGNNFQVEGYSYNANNEKIFDYELICNWESETINERIQTLLITLFHDAERDKVELL